jgi:hypothetical protein
MAWCRELGKFFYVQGRPDFYSDGCVTYCTAVYKHRHSNVQFVEEFVRKNSWFPVSAKKTAQAEEVVLRQIVTTEHNEN